MTIILKVSFWRCITPWRITDIGGHPLEVCHATGFIHNTYWTHAAPYVNKPFPTIVDFGSCADAGYEIHLWEINSRAASSSSLHILEKPTPTPRSQRVGKTLQPITAEVFCQTRWQIPELAWALKLVTLWMRQPCQMFPGESSCKLDWVSSDLERLAIVTRAKAPSAERDLPVHAVR